MEKNQVTVSELGQRLERIETLLRGQKDTLTFDEASVYIGISKSYLYKLTAGCKVPHYKPVGWGGPHLTDTLLCKFSN
jgi:excisionase family DNA binding protein